MMKKLFFFLALLLPIGAWASKIPYAVYSNGTLTFKYGEFTPNGTTSWDVSNTPYNGFLPSSLTWEGGLKHVFFDATFAEARPKSCSYWFDASKELESIEGLEYLNTSEVTSMSCMFEACPKLTSLDLSHFDTSNVTDMSIMFAGATGLTVLDLSSFNTAKVANMDYMFAGSEKGTQFYSGPMKLKKIYVGDGWSAGGGTKMFEYCTSLVGGNGTTYSADHIDYTYARIDAAGTPGYLTKKGESPVIDGNIIAEIDWTKESTYDEWYSEGATVSVGEEGLVIVSNPPEDADYWQPQIPMIAHIPEIKDGTDYQVKFTLNAPAAGRIRLDFTSWDGSGASIAAQTDVEPGEKEYVVDFPDYHPNCTDAFIFYQCGKIPGTHIIKNVQVIDKGSVPVALKYDYRAEDHTAEVIRDYDRRYKDDVVIPATVTYGGETYTVTSISGDAFSDCIALTSVTIPATVTNIDGSPFGNCASLTQIIVDPANTVYDSRNNCNAIIEKATNTLIVGCETTVIPTSVTKIGSCAFWGRWGLKTINIPNSVKEIGSYAFSWSFLNEITLPSELEVLEERAFSPCDLKSITLPASLTTLGKEVFRDCGELTSVTLPDNLEEIPDSCFKYCAKLESIDLKNVKKIGGGAFGNTGLKSLVLPASVKEVCNDAFCGCPIATVDLGQVEKIGDAAFIGTAIEELTIPATLTEMGTDLGVETFSWNGSMKKVVFEDGCTKVFDTMFHGNENLSEVFLPYTITEIQPRAFQSCKSLTRITIPERVEKIGEQAFNLCDALTEVTVENTVPPVLDGTEAISNRANATLNVPSGSRAAYEAAEYWKEFGMITNVLAEIDWTKESTYDEWYSEGATVSVGEEGLVIVSNPPEDADYWQPQIQMIAHIPEIKDGDDYQVKFTLNAPAAGEIRLDFTSWDGSDASRVTFINVEPGEKEYVVDFPDYNPNCTDAFIFYQCGKIPGTHIIKNVQVIDKGMVPADLKYDYHAEDHTAEVIRNNDRRYHDNVVIPATVTYGGETYTVTSISEDAFNSCLKLTSVTIPATVTKISGSPFGNCPSLTQIIVDPANTVYDSRNNCNAIIEKATNTLVFGCKTTVIPNGITRIGDGAFSGCTDLKNINIPSTVKEIGSDAFSWCISLESLNLPSSLETIECYAFNFSNLKSITLPASLTSLGHEAFRNCGELTSVTIPDNMEEIPDSCFKYCYKLESIDLKNVKKIGGGAFGNTGLTSLVLPASVKEVCHEAFCGCPIATVDLGQVEKIGDAAFIGTAIEELTIPATLTEAGLETFSWNGAMKKVTFEEGCTKVFDAMFHCNENLSEVFLPYTITEIQGRAFEFCKSLTSITIPQDVEKIGDLAFNECTNLTEVTVDNPVPPVLDGAEAFSNRANATLNVPKDSRASYEAAEYWKEFGMIVNVLAEENWDGPYWFDDGGISATCNMTSEGIAIYNPKVQEVLWTPQTIVIGDLKLKQNHSYKVIVNAKIPSAGQLQVNLFGWDNWNNEISVNASNDFQDFEFLYENYPLDTNNGGLFFQNGGIAGTSVVRSIQVLDVTNGEEVIAEKNWADPYWFGEEGVGATCEMTDEGLAITNPKVQDEAWTPQTMILKNAKLQKNHTYKVIVNAKIPSDGDLQMQLGSWGSGECWDQSVPVTASSDFQDFEFLYYDYSADAEDGHVLFQNGHIKGTCVIRNIRILDMGDNPVGLKYSYNDEDHTAEVIKNDNGKYKGDVIIPATVEHNGEDYTVTKINEDAFRESNITSLFIPATVTSIEPYSFVSTNDLVQITVDPANTVFDSRNNCNAIIKKATNTLLAGCQATVIPDGITIIGAGAFHGCRHMTSMAIPESVKNIEDDAFTCCYSLEEVQLPANLESLGRWAFLATPIKSITLPATLTSIGTQAFDGCSQLTEVTALNPKPIEIDAETFSNRANATLYLPAGAKKAYKAAPIWKEFKETVEAEHNSVYSYDLTAYLGVPTGMEINLENWDPFTAFQFDIVLPEGITLEKNTSGTIKYTKGKRCDGSRSISVTARDNNTYRVVCISMKNEVITGNDGALLTVYIVANENMGKKTCQAEIKNVIMTTPEEKQVNFDPTTVTIKTKTLLLGDSNDDEFVNVTDLVATINYILGRPTDKFNKTAADISKNHVVDIFDVNLGLGLIKNGARGARMMSRAAVAANDKMTIRDFSISAGMTKQLQVELTNEAAYTGFQFDLVLPEGIKMTSYSQTARIPEDMLVDYNETEGVYRFIGGLGETAITGTSGSIINITVKADENLKGRNLTGYLRDVKLSTSDGKGPEIEETPFKITDETSGDMNKNGKLDPADVKAIADLIMTGEYKAKADVNGDNKVDAADIVIVTNEIK